MIGVKKTARDLAFYAPSHPSLVQSLDRACQALLGLLTHKSPLTITVSRDSLQYGTAPVGKDNPVVRQLAGDLHTRRIQRILLGPRLGPADVRGFLEMLAMDPKRLMEEGGPARVLKAKGVAELHVTELALRSADEPQAEAPVAVEEPAPPPPEMFEPPVLELAPPTPEETPTLESLLNRLEEATDIGTYQRTAARLLEWGWTALTGNDVESFVRILSAFVFHTHPQSVKPP
ncbi:MAG: hypothetical protein ACREJF_06000, partial [Candidatus Methylomirabilales bacterium]